MFIYQFESIELYDHTPMNINEKGGGKHEGEVTS